MLFKNIRRIILLLSLSSSLQAFNWEFNPYVGIYTQWKRISFKEGFGNNLFTHLYPQIYGYAGIKLHKNIAFEIGYETGRTRTRVVALTTGDCAAGTPIPAIISPAIFAGRAKLSGINIGFVGFYAPVDPKFELLGLLGISYVTGSFERHTIQVRGIPYGRSRKLKDMKAVLHMGAGFQYSFWEHVSIRGMIGWKNTGRMVLFAKDGIPGLYLPEVRLRNSITYSIGLVWRY